MWSVREANPLLSYFGCHVGGVTLLTTGPFSEQDLGLKCYHSKVGAVELLLNHCLDRHDEYLVVDMTAGADSFASGLFTKFDLTFLVIEPTKKSLSVYQQYKAYAHDYGVKIAAIGNKIDTEEDVTFIKGQVGGDMLTWIGRSAYIRATEKGNALPFSSLEPAHLEALATMKQAVDQCEQDWERFYQQTVDFHRRNALAWLNTVLGEDVTMQIDPSFSLEACVHEHDWQTVLSYVERYIKRARSVLMRISIGPPCRTDERKQPCLLWFHHSYSNKLRLARSSSRTFWRASRIRYRMPGI